MALGIVSESDFLNEIGDGGRPPFIPDDSVTDDVELAEIIDPKSLGRPSEKENTPESVRNVIAEERINGTPSKELARLFNVGDQIPYAYSKGAHSQSSYHDRNTSVAKHIKSVQERISSRAAKRINFAFDALTPEKIAEEDARSIAGIAKDMSAIIKNMTPEVKVDNNVQFVVFAPRMKDEQDYQVIEVSE
jgi:hypothetical protein